MPEAEAVLAITGAFGYIGSRILRRLARSEAFARVVCLDVRDAEVPLPERFEAHRCDIREGDRLRDLLARSGADTLLHLAFIANPTRDERMEYEVDVLGTRNLLYAAEALGIRRLVAASSDTVYGFFEGTPDHLPEDAPLRPTPGFRYAENKVTVEGMIEAFSARSPFCEVAVLRPCIVMGPNMDNALSRALQQPALLCVRGYDPIMQFIHEDDVAEAFFLALTRPVRGAYNLAADEGIRFSEMARILDKPRIPLPAQLVYPLVEGLYRIGVLPYGSSQLDYIRYPLSVGTEKIRRELGFSPRYTSQDTLALFRGST